MDVSGHIRVAGGVRICLQYSTINRLSTCEATIKRSDFGITYALPGVSDEVELHIEGEFVKQG